MFVSGAVQDIDSAVIGLALCKWFSDFCGFIRKFIVFFIGFVISTVVHVGTFYTYAMAICCNARLQALKFL